MPTFGKDGGKWANFGKIGIIWRFFYSLTDDIRSSGHFQGTG
jgi:hypothetical protein